MLGVLTPSCPLRLCGIVGYDKRVNDIVYCPPAVHETLPSTVVFFGGDVQDFTENMKLHRDNNDYLKWNLEDTAKLMHSHFPNCHVVVIRPSRFDFKTFSCFENFVPGTTGGIPEHTPTHYALHHLERLLQSVSEKICTSPDLVQIKDDKAVVENTLTSSQESSGNKVSNCLQQCPQKIHLDKSNLILIGFSKGCVVLNQFLYEFHYLKTLTPDDHTMMTIVSQIEDMYWLDGGHSGQKNTWITSRSLLETLTRLGIKVHIHVTPYQVNDDKRPWVRKEEKAFSDLLQQLGASVNRVVHFENMCPNLFLHFDVLNVFKDSTSLP